MQFRPHRIVTPVVPFLALAALWVTSSVAAADQVHLKDGSVLVGSIEQVADGKVKITTDFAGELEIDMEKVEGLTTDSAVNVETAEGKQVEGKLNYSSSTGQTAGDVAVPASSVNAAWGVGRPSPAELAAAAAEEAKRPKWTANVSVGISGRTGTTESFNVIGRIEAGRETPTTRLDLFAQGIYAENDNVKSSAEATGGVKYEQDITERWFWFAKGELEYDEIEELSIRATPTAGLGYFVIRKDTHEFKVRGGGGYQHERFFGGDRDDTIVGEAGYDYMIELNEYMRFTQNVTWYPSLEELRDYRIVGETALELPLNEEKSWRFRTGVRNTYNAVPVDDNERLETFYFMRLVYDLY